MNREMLMLVDAISREKNVERDVVFAAVKNKKIALSYASDRIISSFDSANSFITYYRLKNEVNNVVKSKSFKI